MDRRQLLRAGAAAAGGLMMPGATPLEQIQATTKGFRLRLATGSMSAQLVPLRRHVATINHLIDEAGQPHQRRALQLALAEASLLHGWAADDALQSREAHGAALTLTSAASEAGERDLAAVGWTQLATFKFNHFGETDVAIRCAQRAEREAATASIKGNAACWLALTSTARGRTYDALSALERAEVAVDANQANPWKPTTPALLGNFQGIVHARLGRAEEGESLLKRSLLQLPPDDNQVIHLLTDLTETYVLMEEPEGAALTALEAFHSAVQRGSTYKLRRLKEVTQPLSRWLTEPNVAELHAVLRTV